MTGEENYKFIYFNRPTKNNTDHNGVICVAYRITHTQNDPILDYSICFCSPKDRFSKKIARKILLGRMRIHKFRSLACPPITSGYSEPKYIDCLELIKRDIITQKEMGKNFPSWFKEINEYKKE